MGRGECGGKREESYNVFWVVDEIMNDLCTMKLG